MIWLVWRTSPETGIIHSVWDAEEKALVAAKKFVEKLQFITDHDTWEDGQVVPHFELDPAIQNAWTDGWDTVMVFPYEINAVTSTFKNWGP